MSLSLVLYTSKTLADGSHPVMLQAIQGKEVKRISFGFACHQKHWDAKERKFLKSYPNYQEENKRLRRKFQEAEDMWDELSQNGYTRWDDFLIRFKGEEKAIQGVVDMFHVIIEELRAKQKIGNMKKYRQVLSSVEKYKGNVPFEAINYKYLKGYEVFMFTKGAKEGGVNFNMRTLRAVFNRAMMEGVVDQKHYPFFSQLNKKGYSLAHLKTEFKPRPLSVQDIENLKNFPFDEYPHLRKVVYFFLFSYYCNGMSFVDMVFLTQANIEDGRIHYIRKKTNKPMPSIKITPPIQLILDFFAGSKYLFPVLDDAQYPTLESQYKRYLKSYSTYNGNLKRVAKILGITINVSSYTSRHSFGNVLKRRGVDVGKISELYGHSDVETTRHYLAHFTDDDLDNATDLL